MDFNLKSGWIHYDINYQGYEQSGQVISDCNSIQFINLGTAVVTIDAVIVLQQNQSFAVNGNQGEYTNKQFTVVFGAGVANLVVARKNYIKSPANFQ